MNKVILLGRLTKDPEIRYSQKTQLKVVTFTLAVNRKYVKQGEERQTDFINIVAYSKSADFAEKYFKKGLQICVSGRIETRSWNDDNDIKHYATNVIAEEFDFADTLKKDDNKAHIIPEDSSEDNFTNLDDLPF